MATSSGEYDQNEENESEEQLGDKEAGQWRIDNDFSLKIIDQSNKPIANAKFLILDANTDEKQHEVVSDEAGLIYFESPSGLYNVSLVDGNQTKSFTIPDGFSNFIPDSGPAPVTPVITFER